MNVQYTIKDADQLIDILAEMVYAYTIKNGETSNQDSIKGGDVK